MLLDDRDHNRDHTTRHTNRGLQRAGEISSVNNHIKPNNKHRVELAFRFMSLKMSAVSLKTEKNGS